MFFYHDGNDDRKVFLLPDCFREKHLNEDDLKSHLDQFQNHSDEEEMDSYMKLFNGSFFGHRYFP